MYFLALGSNLKIFRLDLIVFFNLFTKNYDDVNVMSTKNIILDHLLAILYFINKLCVCIFAYIVT